MREPSARIWPGWRWALSTKSMGVEMCMGSLKSVYFLELLGVSGRCPEEVPGIQ